MKVFILLILATILTGCGGGSRDVTDSNIPIGVIDKEAKRLCTFHGGLEGYDARQLADTTVVIDYFCGGEKVITRRYTHDGKELGL
jgi:hypothetical protein